MSNLANMKVRIALELARADLTTQIADAINDAIAIYQKERFRFSEAIPNAPLTFPTVAGRSIYTSADNANISTLFGFDDVSVAIGNSIVSLTREHPQVLEQWNQNNTTTGQPGWYAYEGNQLILSPVPSQVWTVTLGIFKRVAAPASDAEANNPWMVDAERLIRSRAKYEIAMHVTRNMTMAAAMSPDPPAPGEQAGMAYREWRSLKGEANRVAATGRISAMRF